MARIDRRRWKRPDPDLAQALDYALDIRKFEINLYWKRATYFWTLLLVAFGGYLVLWKEAVDPEQEINDLFVRGIAALGFLTSLAWYLVNRGSKYWQENWEAHVDRLEGRVIGALYRWPLPRHQFNWLDPTEGFPYSVSRVNQIISLTMTWVWLGLFVLALLPREVVRDLSEYLTGGLVVATGVVALGLCASLGRGKRRKHDPFKG